MKHYFLKQSLNLRIKVTKLFYTVYNRKHRAFESLLLCLLTFQHSLIILVAPTHGWLSRLGWLVITEMISHARSPIQVLTKLGVD